MNCRHETYESTTYTLAVKGKCKCKFTGLMKKYTRFWRGCNEFEAECTVGILGTFVSVTNKGSLDIETHLETTKHMKNSRGESSLSKIIKYACTYN
jgi:hypothetical protein